MLPGVPGLRAVPAASLTGKRAPHEPTTRRQRGVRAASWAAASLQLLRAPAALCATYEPRLHAAAAAATVFASLGLAVGSNARALTWRGARRLCATDVAHRVRQR